jgi:hypothetical protein
MNLDVQRDENKNEFFINRRRNLKSNEKSDAKNIFIAYAERSTHDLIEHFINAIKSSHDVIQSKRAKEKTRLSNEIIIYDNQNMIEKFLSIITKFNIWKKHDILIVISSKSHMSINFKSNWADKIKSNRIYSLKSNERVIINEIFDNLHSKEKMK